MLRIGKNKDQQDDEHTNDKQNASAYNTPRDNYPSYQATTPETKPASDTSQISAKAMTESETLARDIKEGTLSGFIGNGTSVTGEATFKAMLRVDGHLSGRISSGSGTLIVGANGKVDANIEVAVAVIHGAINGDIIATQRLELGRAAKVNGNIQTPSLVIEQGGVFEGTCKMLQMSAAADKSKKDQPLDASSMRPLTADGSTKTPDAGKPADVAKQSPVTNVSSATN
ncbi:MAG: polymer-forming cytoskeletal protein [Pyrinomonadaceae bacterium]|nr:polymer-forming cytoskeletal protein [Pyrinomonadaceae bacterium]